MIRTLALASTALILLAACNPQQANTEKADAGAVEVTTVSRAMAPYMTTPPAGQVVQMTQAAYNALAVKDPATLYVIVG